jgi:hypothetical protein
MKELKSKTLCELIDFINSMLNEEITDTSKKNLFNHHVEELAFRLSISKASTIIFAFVFFHSLRGCYMTKREVVVVVFTHPTINIYLSIQELIKNNLIKYYRNHSRRPEMCFYTLDELDKLIVSNQAPISHSKNTDAKSVISVKPFENGEDYWILLNDKKIGVAYHLLTEFGAYTAMIGDYMVLHFQSIEEMIDKLIILRKEKKLKL